MASFLDSITGKASAEASRKAAADQRANELAAIAGINQAGSQAQADYAGIAPMYDRYIDPGDSAMQRLMMGLGLAGDPTQFTKAYRSLPGYEAGRESALDAVSRRANAGNMYQSGRTIKAFGRAASDYEDQRVKDYLSLLMGPINLGYGATGAKVGTLGQGIGANLGARTSAFGGALKSAGTIGQGDIAAAQAEQSALGNLLATGASLAGTAIGGPVGGQVGRGLGQAASGLGQAAFQGYTGKPNLIGW